jgi:hypothetical protein
MDLTSANTFRSHPMRPGLRIRRLCTQLAHLADVLDDGRAPIASPSSLEECLGQMEANAMLIEHQMSDPPPVIAKIHPVRPSDARRPVLLRFPSSPADSAPDTQC